MKTRITALLLLFLFLMPGHAFATGIGVAEVILDLQNWTYLCSDNLNIFRIDAKFNMPSSFVSTLRSGERQGIGYLKLDDATDNGNEFAAIQKNQSLTIVTSVALAGQADPIPQGGFALMDAVTEFRVYGSGFGRLTVFVPYSIEAQCIVEPGKVGAEAVALVSFGAFSDSAICEEKRTGLLAINEMFKDPNGGLLTAKLSAQTSGGAAAVPEPNGLLLLGLGMAACGALKAKAK